MKMGAAPRATHLGKNAPGRIRRLAAAAGDVVDHRRSPHPIRYSAVLLDQALEVLLEDEVTLHGMHVPKDCMHIHTSSLNACTRVTPMCHPHACDVKACAASISVPGLMPLANYVHTAGAQRGMLTVGVALIPASGRMFVKGLTGTTCPMYQPQRQYGHMHAVHVSSLSTAEYMEFAHDVLGQLSRRACVIWCMIGCMIETQHTEQMQPVSGCSPWDTR